MNQRIEWIDTSRGICAFCVLLAHTILYGIERQQLYLQIYTPFFLMLFFFISGYLFKDRPFKESIKKLLNGLVIPYLALTIIEIPITRSVWKPIYLNGNYDIIINEIVNIILGKKLWFIPCLIMVQIYYIFLNKFLAKFFNFNKNIHLKLAIGTLLLFSAYLIRNWDYQTATAYWYANTAIFALAYFMIGDCFKEYYPYIDRWINNQKKYSKRYSSALLIIFIAASVFFQSTFNVHFDVYRNYYESPVFFWLISLTGIFAVLFFCMNYKLPNYLNLLGQNSLLLFAFNDKFGTALTFIFDKLNVRYFVQADNIYVLIFCFVQGFLIILFSILINRYIPQIVGKKNWI